MAEIKEINGFKVIITDSEEEGGKEAFKLFEEEYNKGAKVYGLATGSTPLTLYEEIKKSDLDLTDRISINLDEYAGLPADHEQSYNYFMKENLFKSKPFQKSYVPNGTNDEEEETARYDKIVEANPIDLQILGIGENAHIAFNEPGTSFDSTTHKVRLTDNTIEANKRFFESEDDVPRYAYTMGLKSILSAKEILMLAYGKRKAQAVYDMLYSDPDPEIPASALQHHDNVYVILDKEATELLKD